MNILEKQQQCVKLQCDIKELEDYCKKLENILTDKKSEYEKLSREIKNYNFIQARKEIIAWLGDSRNETEYFFGISTNGFYYIRAIIQNDIFVSGKDSSKGNKEQLFQILEKYDINSVFIHSTIQDWGVSNTYIEFGV